MFWNRIEQIYGQIPHLIKLVLQINGFDSFLALKGIRNDEKNEFFKSLESTVLEFVTSDRASSTKDDLETEIAAHHQSFDDFKLKPGHRNYIMNLMIEIDKSDVNEFFGRCSDITAKEPEEIEKVNLETPSKHQYSIAHNTPPATLANLIVRRSNTEKHIVVSRDEHGYSQENETEYVLEEEYLTDDTMDSMFKVDYGVELQDTRKRKSSSSLAASSAKRRPAQMYNEEFMAKSVNPRRRRVTVNKTYPANDEGTRERFTDLIHQVRLRTNFISHSLTLEF